MYIFFICLFILFNLLQFLMFVIFICMYFIWVYRKNLFFFSFQWRLGHVCIFIFILTDTKNVICILYLWCPLDEGLEYFLGVLLLILLAPICILFCYTYIDTYKYAHIYLFNVSVSSMEIYFPVFHFFFFKYVNKTLAKRSFITYFNYFNKHSY